MDTKIWTYKRISDGAEATLTTEEAVHAIGRAIRGIDPFDNEAQGSILAAGRSKAPADTHGDLPLAA